MLRACFDRLRDPVAIATVTVVLTAGLACTPSQPPPTSTPPEASFAKQAAAVREGRSVGIRVDRQPVTDGDLAELDGLQDKLRRLNLSHTTITDAGLARIAQMHELEQLRLESAAITDAGLADLEQLTKLRHLHLIDAAITDAGLEHLEKLTGLRSLYLDGSQASDAGMSRLVEALPNVHLHFDGGHHRHDAHADDHPHQSDVTRPADAP